MAFVWLWSRKHFGSQERKREGEGEVDLSDYLELEEGIIILVLKWYEHNHHARLNQKKKYSIMEVNECGSGGEGRTCGWRGMGGGGLPLE